MRALLAEERPRAQEAERRSGVEWPLPSIALWASLFGVFSLASCGGGGSSPEEIRACLVTPGSMPTPGGRGDGAR